MDMNLKEIVKDNFVFFNYYRQGHFYYLVPVNEKEGVAMYQFPVPLEDIATATMERKDKAITFMRYIRKAIDDKTFIRHDTI